MKDYLKTTFWGIAGLLVGFSIITQAIIPIMGRILIILSFLMFVLAVFQFFKYPAIH